MIVIILYLSVVLVWLAWDHRRLIRSLHTEIAALAADVKAGFLK